MTTADQCMILEDRISREKKRINELIDKVTAVDQEFTEVDMNELNGLKQSVMACQKKVDDLKEQRSTELVARRRPPVRLTSNSACT